MVAPPISGCKNLPSQTRPTKASSFIPDQVNNRRGFQNWLSYWKHFSGCFFWGKTPPNRTKLIFQVRHTYKWYILHKLSKNGQFCPQQGLKKSTDGYTGLPLPTRWSMQRSQCKGERSSSWVTNLLKTEHKEITEHGAKKKEHRKKDHRTHSA